MLCLKSWCGYESKTLSILLLLGGVWARAILRVVGVRFLEEKGSVIYIFVHCAAVDSLKIFLIRVFAFPVCKGFCGDR